MNNPANPKCNAEGYNDPTAFYGTQTVSYTHLTLPTTSRV